MKRTTFTHPSRIVAALFAFAVALTMVVGTGAPADAAWTKNCAKVNLRHPSGIGKVNAVDVTPGTPVTTFTRSNKLFKKVKKLDADRDRIACERLSGGGSTACVPSTSPDVIQARATILQKTNEYRGANGRAALQPMDALNTVAQCWTQHMAASGAFAHNPNYLGQYPPGWLGAAENIAMDATYNSVVQEWINSPPHQTNLLGDYNHIGIGYAVDGGGHTYFTQNFAKY